MKEFYEKNKKSIHQLGIFALVLLGVWFVLKYMLKLFAPFIVAIILSAILSRPVDFICRKSNFPRTLATLLSMITILTAILFGGYFVINILAQQMIAFGEDFPQTYQKMMDMIHSFQESYYSFFNIFPAEVRVFFDTTILTMLPELATGAGRFARTHSVSLVKALPSLLIFVIMTIIATFFVTKDKATIFGFFKRQIPPSLSRAYRVIREDVFGALWGYVRAQGIMMSFSGCIAMIGLSVLGYSYAILLGLLIAVIDALPVFGPGFILWPWMAVKLFLGEYRFALGLGIIYLSIIACRQMIEPKILSTQIGLHPLVTLAAMYVGLRLVGPLGVIAGPVFMIAVKSLQRADFLPQWK